MIFFLGGVGWIDCCEIETEDLSFLTQLSWGLIKKGEVGDH